MKLKQILFLSFILPAFVFAETVYKTRDADGNVIFSDVPSEGAETIEIEKAQTINVPKPKSTLERKAVKLSPDEIKYERLEITSPENESTIRSNEGLVNVSVQITPSLVVKHVLVFYLDGKEVSSGRDLQLSLKDLDRGTHTVTAEVQNEKGKVLKRSEKLTFHLRKDSKLFKNRKDVNIPVTPPVSSDVPSSDTIPIPSL